MTAATDVGEAAARIERDNPGYHVWVSDEGWWYATRTRSRARGRAATIAAENPGKLAAALAADATPW